MTKIVGNSMSIEEVSPTSHFQKIIGSPTHKRVTIVIIVVLLLLTIAGITFIINKHRNTTTNNQCMDYYIPIEKSLNTSVNPCEDFYQFACSAWSNNIPCSDETNNHLNTFSMLQDYVNNQKEHVFKNTKPSSSLPDMVNDALNFYDLCMDAIHSNILDFRSFIVHLNNIGGWPLLNNWDSTSYDWVKASAYLSKTFNIDTIFSINTYIDDYNSNISHLCLSNPEFEPDYSTLSNAFAFHYLKFVVQSLRGPDDAILFDLARVSKVESQWRKYFIMKESNPVRLTFRQLSLKIPYFDWLNYVQLMMNDTLHALNKEITMDDIVYVENLNGLKMTMVRMYSTLFSKSNIANLFGWFLLQKMEILIPGFIREVAYSNERGITEKEFRTASENVCFEKVIHIYEDSVDYLYVHNFPVSRLSNSQTLVNYLKGAFKETIQKSQWMDYPTRKAALTKLTAMQAQIGCDNFFHNKTAFDKHYAGFPHPTSNALDSYVTLTSFYFSKMIADLKSENSKKHFSNERSITQVGAFYNLQKNNIVFPMSLHFPPFYYFDGLWALNFGAIGSIIGHEIMHGFDPKGSRRDANGNLNEWWSDSSNKTYNNLSTCFKDQYSSYMNSLNFTHNNVSTLNEDIADNEGLRVAYLAYKNWKKKHGPDKTYEQLPAYTPDQMFYLGFASMWCHNTWSQFSVHSPNEVRVIGALANSESFSQAFDCPKGSLMNPEKKCLMW